MEPPATGTTADELSASVAATLLRIPLRDVTSWNWGCEPSDQSDVWDVDGRHHIAGVPVIVDLDWIVGQLADVVDRDTGTRTYVAVITRHGPRPDGTYDHVTHHLDASDVTLADAARWVTEHTTALESSQ